MPFIQDKKSSITSDHCRCRLIMNFFQCFITSSLCLLHRSCLFGIIVCLFVTATILSDIHDKLGWHKIESIVHVMVVNCQKNRNAYSSIYLFRFTLFNSQWTQFHKCCLDFCLSQILEIKFWPKHYRCNKSCLLKHEQTTSYQQDVSVVIDYLRLQTFTLTIRIVVR